MSIRKAIQMALEATGKKNARLTRATLDDARTRLPAKPRGRVPDNDLRSFNRGGGFKETPERHRGGGIGLIPAAAGVATVGGLGYGAYRMADGKKKRKR